MSIEPETLHQLLAAYTDQPDSWTLRQVHPRVWHGLHLSQDDIALKLYPDAASAAREFAVLRALRDFGINLAPEAHLLINEGDAPPALLMSWLWGDPIPAPPPATDEEGWHRLMAALGVAHELKPERYAEDIPPLGWGIESPAQLMDQIAALLADLDASHPAQETLAQALEKAREQVAPEWHYQPAVGLLRRDPALSNLMQEGCCHILALDWDQADWGDIAAEVGLWSAHPDFEEVPAAHWVWVRWEFARLVRDQHLVPRATVYSRLGQLYYAARLSLPQPAAPTPAQARQQQRYLQRVARLFR